MKWEQRSHTACVYTLREKIQVHSSIVQHAQNHENITLDICNDYKIWANSKGHLTFLKFQYLWAMQICLNKLQNILFGYTLFGSQGAKQMYAGILLWQCHMRKATINPAYTNVLPVTTNPLFMMNFCYSNTFQCCEWYWGSRI